jgi:hypothetical protein
VWEKKFKNDFITSTNVALHVNIIRVQKVKNSLLLAVLYLILTPLLYFLFFFKKTVQGKELLICNVRRARERKREREREGGREQFC